MAAIVYLDVDDEITSAASRIRSTDDRRVVLVVPYGSRLATSRINFRLLAREAQTRGRRLWIVAADGATRALAASAGLGVFGSVSEYESALETPPPSVDGNGGPPAAQPSSPRPRRRPARGDQAVAPPPEPPTNGPAAGDLDATVAMPTATLGAATAASEPGTSAPVGSLPASPPLSSGPIERPGGPSQPRSVTASTVARPTPSLPVVGRRRGWALPRSAAIVVAAVLALLLAVGGVAAYVFLPSASITVTAYPQEVAPLDLTVRADPTATAADPDNNVVAAQRLSLSVQASGTFKVRGKRIEESKASGEVTFQSYNTGASNTIPGGSIVSTEGGVRFRTTRSITIPPASFVFPQVFPGEAKVAVSAVKAGTEGNVPANAITVVPSGEDPNLTKVKNESPTTGGKHEEFPEVEKADVQRALSSLRDQLAANFDEALADPSQVPGGLTVFPDTKELGDPTPTVETDALIGKEIESFDLGMTATGTVTAVDENAVRDFAASRIGAQVSPGYELVDGSVKVTPGDPTIDGEAVVFPVSVMAQQVRVLDEKALLGQVKGKSIPQARSILEQFGVVEISVWPDWVTAIPSIDARVSLTTETSAATPDGEPSREPSPQASASTTP